MNITALTSRLWVTLIAVCSIVDHSLAHTDFSHLIQTVKPHVVKIEVTNKSGKRDRIEREKIKELLGEYSTYYKEQFEETPRKALGTGFAIKVSVEKKQVHIFTAEHVVRHAKTIYIRDVDDKKFKASLVWADKKNDVALLLVDDCVPILCQSGPATLADGKAVEGEEVLAISGAHGLSLSSSIGIVSAVDVKLKGKGPKLIQTDAAINRGSSGGPLFNAQGEVMGLISNIYSNTGSFSGAAFVVPAPVLIDLLKKRGF